VLSAAAAAVGVEPVLSVAGTDVTPLSDTAPLAGVAVAEDEAAEAPAESVIDADAPAEPLAVTDAGGTDETPLTLTAPPPPPAAAVEEAPDESVDEDPDVSVDEDPDVSVDEDPEIEESVVVVVDELPLLPPLLPDEPPLFTPAIVKVHVLTS